MLARKLTVLACLLCAGSAFATELEEAVRGAMSDDYHGIVTDKAIATEIPSETVATGGEEGRPSGKEQDADSNT